jgi:hypothetical protein
VVTQKWHTLQLNLHIKCWMWNQKCWADSHKDPAGATSLEPTVTEQICFWLTVSHRELFSWVLLPHILHDVVILWHEVTSLVRITVAPPINLERRLIVLLNRLSRLGRGSSYSNRLNAEVVLSHR